MDLQGINSMLSTINPESHINHLPVELLQQIFLLFVHDLNPPDYHPSIFSLEYNAACAISAIFTAPPLLFTRVCRLWPMASRCMFDHKVMVAHPGYASGRNQTIVAVPSISFAILACLLWRSASHPSNRFQTAQSTFSILGSKFSTTRDPPF